MPIREEPLIVKDVILMSPGEWNGWRYDPDELKKAFASTNWQDEHITSLFLDHPENPANAAKDWIGRVKNPRQMPDGTVKGDLEIWDEDIAMKLTKAKANFGVSPRVIGNEDLETKSFLDFYFDNFCIVAKPAQSTAVLHLSKNLKFDGAIRQLNKEDLAKVTAMEEKRKKMGLSPAQFYAAPRDPPSSSALPIFDAEHVRNAMARFNQTKFKSAAEKAKARKKIIAAAKKFKIEISSFKEMVLTEEEIELLENLQSTNMLNKNMKGGKKQMSEEEKKTEEVETTEEPEKVVEESKSETESTEELSDEQVLSIMNEDLDGFNAYAKEVRAKNPSISLKELAKRYKVQKERMNFVEELSDAEATVLLKKLLSKMGVEGFSAKTEKQLASNELAKKIEALEKSIKELGKKEKVPAPKAVKNLTDSKSEKPLMFGKAPSEGVMELAQMFGIR